MPRGVGHVDRVGGRAAEQRDGAEHVGVGGVGLGVLAEVAAQRADALALDTDHRDPGRLEPMGDREPGHAGRLHHREDGAVRRQPVPQAGDQASEAVGRQAEADRLAVRASAVEDAGDVIATDGEVDADGALTLTHEALPAGCGRSPGRRSHVLDPWPVMPPQSPHSRLPRPGPGHVVTSPRRWGALTAG
jgi:hypothetical protein